MIYFQQLCEEIVRYPINRYIFPEFRCRSRLLIQYLVFKMYKSIVILADIWFLNCQL